MARISTSVGRPPTRSEDERGRRGRVLGFQIEPEDEAQLESIAAAQGQTKSELARSAVLETIRPKPYGLPGVALLQVLEQLMRSVVVNARPSNEPDWLSDATTMAAVKGALSRFIEKFPMPPGEPAAAVVETSVRRADEMLWELGTVDDAGYGPWAASVRADLGEPTATRLIEKREADRAALLAGPPREPPATNPGHAALWDAAFAAEIIKQKIARLTADSDIAPAELSFARSSLRYEIRTMQTDPATRAALLALLAKAVPDVGFGANPAVDPQPDRDGS